MVKKKTSTKGSRYSVRYSTDRVAKNIWLHLLRDFRSSEGLDFCRSAENAFSASIAEFRDYKFPELGFIDAGRFKRYKQLEGLLKKYRFSDDKYTDEELEQRTFSKFLEEQELFSTPGAMAPLGALVCQRARSIARGILGTYHPEETVVRGRFGRKSSIGCPLAFAYIDHKLTDVKAFTGSSECSKWFMSEVVSNDEILSELVQGILRKGAPDLEHESLNLVNVPKSWKVHRTITPLTLITLFYSYGVGSQVEERLRDCGLDIKRLQQRHRVLIKGMSLSRKSATADLSSASQSLTSGLLNRILPREWYRAISRTFSRQVVYGGKSYYTESVLPMGNGLTFPVETLVFYVVLKAIAELAGVKGLISVYGDDLIYPSKLHRYVAVIFPLLNFRLNLDKTFVKAPFRESCGSDFYRGIDVRPAYLPESCQSLTRTKYASWLYKVYNSLVRRWDPLEIRSTLQFILVELGCLGLDLFRVPPSFPDTAGVKVETPWVIPLDTQTLPWCSVKVVFQNGSRWCRFRYLSYTPEDRYVVSVTPYYWLALQGLDDFPELDNFWDTERRSIAPRQALSWVCIKHERFGTRNGKRYRFVQRQFKATCPSRTDGRVSVVSNMPKKNGMNQSDSVSDWI